MSYLAAAVMGYLLGALPFGWLVARWHGVDIFEVGSRNPGATNVKRCVGKGAGNLVFALDCLKGAAAVLWLYAMPAQLGEVTVWHGLIGLAAAMTGHGFSAFTGFRGGKGVATMFGGTIALMPVAAAIGAAVWVVLFYSTRYVSVASMGLSLSLPVSAGLLYGFTALFWFALALAVFVVFRHRENIGRLMHGNENRFARKTRSATGGEHP